MVHSRLYASILFGLAIQPATEVLAQSGPRLPVWLATPPLPEGAIRRFGNAPPPLPASTKAAATAPRANRLEEPGPRPTRTVMALTHDGKQLVVADYTGRIDLWDVATGRLAKRLQEPGPEPIHSVAVSPDGRWLACGRTRPDIQLWDLAAGKVAGTIPLKRAGQNSRPGTAERMAFAPDGKILYTGIDIYSDTGDHGSTAWEIPSGKRLWNVNGVGYNLAADPRGRWVMTGILDDPARLALFEAATGRVVRAMPIEPSWEPGEGGSVAVDASATMDRMFTPDGGRLLSIHSDGTLRAWDPLAGRELTRIKWGTDRSAEPGGLACSPDGKWVAVREAATIYIWELASSRRVRTIAGHDSPVREMAFTRDGGGLIGNAGPAPVLWSLAPKELPGINRPADVLWDALGSEDAAAAYGLQWALIADSAAAVKLFASRVRPAELVLPRARFDRLVAGVDSPEYAERERSERDLTAAGITIPAAWLRQALAKSGSEEVQARLNRVLSRRETPSPARWRLERAVQVLELAGTPAAVAALKEWSAGPADSDLTEEAAAAVKRLAARAR
jgi:WD40 repeat protein